MKAQMDCRNPVPEGEARCLTCKKKWKGPDASAKAIGHGLKAKHLVEFTIKGVLEE
jgi:hypothetical protein